MKVIVIFECHSGRKRNPRFYFHSNSKTVVGYYTPGKRGSQSSSALSGTRQGTAFSHRQERLTARWVSERVRTTRRGRHQKCGGEQAETRTYVVVDQKHSTGGRKSRATLRYGTARHGRGWAFDGKTSLATKERVLNSQTAHDQTIWIVGYGWIRCVSDASCS